MNFVSQPNGTVGFGFGMDEFQACLGYGLTVCIIKDGDGILLAVETWIDDKTQLINDSAIEHAAIQLSSTLQGNRLDVEMLVDGFEDRLCVFEVLHHHVRNAFPL